MFRVHYRVLLSISVSLVGFTYPSDFPDYPGRQHFFASSSSFGKPLETSKPFVWLFVVHSLLTDRRVDVADEMPPRKKSKIKVSKHSCRRQIISTSLARGIVLLYLTLPWQG